MSDTAPQLRRATASVPGRFLVRPARSGRARFHWIGFHGYAQTAEAMFEPFARAARGDDWLVASVQGLHAFYAGRSNEVVASWMTRQDRELAIASNVAYVDDVAARLADEFGEPEARVYAGFSQGVGMAWRAGVLGRHACAGVIAAGGDVPPELFDGAPRNWPGALIVTGTRDAYYPPESMQRDAARLRAAGADVGTCAFDGGHEWSDAVVEAAAARLAEIEARTRR